MRSPCAAAAAALALLGAPAAGEGIPGDVFVTEKAAGSVANVRAGGDLSGQGRFATGLSAPTGICVTPDGEVLVAESATGQVTNITLGGDFTNYQPFASGLETPMDLHCDEDRILVVERNAGQQGEITDISEGGDFSGRPAFAAGIGAGAAALAFEPVEERLLASDAALGRVFDVTSGGVYLAVPPLASGGAGTAGLFARGVRRLAANPGSGAVVDFAAGGDLASAPVFAAVPGVVNLLEAGGIGLLAASGSTGALYDITAGGDFGAAAPFASGLSLDAEFAGMALFAGCGDGVVDEGEACDDNNVADGDGCNSNCRIRLCLTPPSDACVVAERASLGVREREKKKGGVAASFQLALRAFGEPVTQPDFGQPVFDTTRYDVCVYGQEDELVAQMIVSRGFDTCGKKERACWQEHGNEGFRYQDPDLDAAGIGSIVAEGGAAGKGSLRVSGRRKKGEDGLPRMTQSLEGDGRATVQVMVSDGRCFGAELPNVQRATEGQFKAGK
jgi:cysteine-rich repeat protein